MEITGYLLRNVEYKASVCQSNRFWGIIWGGVKLLMIKFLYRLASDFVKIHSPISKVGDGFAFIVHPRGYEDIVSNMSFLKFFPKKSVIYLFNHLWPFTVSSIRGLKSQNGGYELNGYVIGMPMLAHQIMEKCELARKKINQAIKLAQQKGVKVIGLGALTGSVTEGGAGLKKKNGVLITAGRAYTSYIIKEYVQDVISRLELEKKNIIIAIIGAAGGVGSAVARILAIEPFKKIILVDLERKLERVGNLLDEIKTEKTDIIMSHKVNNVKEADIIITATNAPEAVIESDDVKTGAVIIDDAQPSDISFDIVNTRDDIIIIEAGVITTPNIHVGTNFKLANKDETYCCLGEVMTLVASGLGCEYDAGNIKLETINNIAMAAKNIGFRLAPYQAFGRIVTEEQIEKVKKIIHNNYR